jgi:hypothetical protein
VHLEVAAPTRPAVVDGPAPGVADQRERAANRRPVASRERGARPRSGERRAEAAALVVRKTWTPARSWTRAMGPTKARPPMTRPHRPRRPPHRRHRRGHWRYRRGHHHRHHRRHHHCNAVRVAGTRAVSLSGEVANMRCARASGPSSNSDARPCTAAQPIPCLDALRGANDPPLLPLP